MPIRRHPALADPTPQRMAAHPLPEDLFAELFAAGQHSTGRKSRALYYRSLWDLAYATDPWFLLVDERTPVVAGMPPPLVAAAGPVRVLLFYSSEIRAAVGTHRLNLLAAHGAVGVLRMPRDNACNWFAGFEGADAITWNADGPTELACLRLSDAVAGFERRFDRLLPRMAGRFGEAVNRGGAPMRARLIRRLLALPEWWFVATARRSDAPVLITSRSGFVTLPFFTDAERVRRGGAALIEPLREGEAVPLPIEPHRGFSYLRRVQERERPTRVALIVNDVRGDVGEAAVLPLDELIAAGEAIGW